MANTHLHRFPAGFTLAELLTSVAIFGLLALTVMANFHNGGLNDDLRVSAEQLVGNLRRVQNLATVGQTVAYPAGQNTVPPGGYGISVIWLPTPYVDENGDTVSGVANQYKVFADFGGAPDGTGSCAVTPDEEYYAECSDQLVEQGVIQFKPSVSISSLALYNWCSGQNCSIGFDPIDIVFKPPHPTPLIEGHNGTVKIELVHAQTKKCRVVTINAISGQISQQIGSISQTGCYIPQT